MADVYDQDREPVDGPSRPVHLTVVEARALVTVVREHRKYSAVPGVLDELERVLVGRIVGGASRARSADTPAPGRVPPPTATPAPDPVQPRLEVVR